VLTPGEPTLSVFKELECLVAVGDESDLTGLVEKDLAGLNQSVTKPARSRRPSRFKLATLTGLVKPAKNLEGLKADLQG